MASKCRTWDNDYFIEVHASKKPEEEDLIEPLGERRGKPLKDVRSLSLPKAALDLGKAENTNLKESVPRAFAPAVGTGRGQLLKERALSNLTPARLPGERNMRTTQSIHSMANFPPLPSTGSSTPLSPGVPHRPLPSTEPWSRDNQPSSFNESCDDTASKSSKSKENIMAASRSDIIAIQNLPVSLKEEELLELLTPYGDVCACSIEKDSNSQSLGTAIVRMESCTACEWIINCYHGYEYPGGAGKLVCRFVIE